MFINAMSINSKTAGKTLAVFLAASITTTVSAAEREVPDRFSLLIGAREYWDSNFARNAVEDSERYTHSRISASLNERISKQYFSLGISGSDYKHAERDDLDVSFYEGNASWRSQWTSRIKTDVAWKRDAYAVDRLEFAGKDVVAREDLSGQLSWDLGKHLGLTLGGRQVAQTHSNDERENLDFDDDEVLVAVTYSTANKSFLALRMREGEREYVHPLPDAMQVLDFDYRQLELEGVWALTRKTQVGFTLGRFKREGEINSGTGTQALIDFDWAISEKLKLSLSYSQSEPALGETSDSPSDVRSSRISLGWEPFAKWTLTMGAGYSKQTYLARLLEPARDEKITSITPIAISYRFSERFRFRLDSQWVDRESPLVYRDYEYSLASIGVDVIF
jgi:hypothetical protein